MTDGIAYNDRDDGLHHYDSPGYYEWWYFDAQFNNGYICTIRLSWRHAGSGGPSFEIEIYAPDGGGAHAKESFEAGSGRASAEWCDVALGSSYARQEGPDLYRVVVRGGKAGADLTFRRRVPGWKFSPSGLVMNGASGRHGWVNAIPRADVEGRLFFGRRQVPVRGTGYHDHNWGDAEIGKSFGRWVRGRLFDSKYTMVYGWLMPVETGASLKPFVYAAMGNQPVFASSEIEMKVGAEALHQASGNAIATDIELRGKVSWGVELACRMVMTKLLGWQREERSGGGRVDSYRRLSKCIAEVSIGTMDDRASGDAIDEYVLLG